MPFRISILAALVCAWIGVTARADEKIITGGFDLTALSASLTSSNKTLNVRIDNYTTPGELKITPAANGLDTIVLQRFSPDSDGVIKVDSTFIDSKGFTGTLILKNLAFRLTKPKSVLIAGFDPNQLNNHLVLDSCTVYADTLDGLFLSWQADTASRLIIRNSWFVARGSTTNTASIQIATGTVTLSNCLFNFAGMINGSSISKRFDAFSNTANRVQFKLNASPGAEAPAYSFAQNLIAYHGPVNTLGGDPYYVLSASGFSDPRSIIQGNRMYSVWKGFDAPSGAKGKAGVKIDSLYDGKSSSELWDWYTDAKDDSTGLLSGNSLLRRYNVLPGKTFADTLIGTDSVRVTFKSADYPRMFRWNIGAPPDLLDSAYRSLAILPGRLYFGPFQVDNIRDNSIAKYGKPILLAQSAGNLFLPQASTSRYQELRVFQNRSPGARVFALVDSGNTPRGIVVEPVLASAEKYEHIRFSQVIGAGQTILKATTDESVPDSLRFLKRTFWFVTSATTSGQVTFSSKLNDVRLPWSKPSEGAWFWYWKAKDTLIPATNSGVIWGDSLLYGSFTLGSQDTSFVAYLVEKLSVHAGSTTKSLSGATLLSVSSAGYQLYTDTSLVDPTRFGSATKGFKFTWTGRGANDSLSLILKAPVPEAQVFVQVPGKAEAVLVSMATDSLGNFRIPIGPDDSGKVFFAGVKFNVLAGTPFGGIVNGVKVDSIYSTTPGVVAFRNLSQSDAQKLGNKKDSVFQNTRYLGGKTDASIGLNVTRDFTITFGITKPLTSDTTETWALIGGTWVNISAVANVVGDTDKVLIRYASQQPLPTQIVVLERFKAPGDYFKPNLDPRVDSLVFTLLPKAPGTTNPVVAYCLEVTSLGINGDRNQSECVKQDPTQPTQLPIQPKTAYAYRIVYFVGADTATVALPQPLAYPDQFGWEVKDALQGNPDLDSLPQGRWQLVTLPAVDTSLKALLDSLPRTDTNAVRDTTKIYLLTQDKKGKTVFDSTQGYEGFKMGGSKAVLLASSHPMALTLKRVTAPTRKTLKPEVVIIKPGWNLVGNPFPVRIWKNSIKPPKPHPVRWWQLLYDASISDKYKWDTTLLTLPPLRGFAYYSAEAESLIIDPNDTTPPAPVAHAKVAAGSGRVRVGIESPWGAASMALVHGAGEYPVRYLPMPSSGLELRVGGEGGYFLKPAADLERVDEQVEIRSDREGTVRFVLGEGGRGPAFALIDQSTGAVYDRSSAAEVPVSQGSRNYRLLAGDPSFVDEKTHAFLASAPAAVALSQNFPNPARGLTRIAIDWPATRSQDRRATLEVLDLQGRRLALRRLEGIQVGRQLIEVDASAWKPGIYVYRLAVVTGGRVLRLQKRMLVAP